MSESFIFFRDVVKDYPMGEVTVHALRGLDLEIARGEFVVILGPSGCGKSTTLNLLGGLDNPTSGDLEVGGEVVSRLTDRNLTEYRRTTIGFVFQFFNLIPTLSASENVELALGEGVRRPCGSLSVAAFRRRAAARRDRSRPRQSPGGAPL